MEGESSRGRGGRRRERGGGEERSGKRKAGKRKGEEREEGQEFMTQQHAWEGSFRFPATKVAQLSKIKNRDGDTDGVGVPYQELLD